MSEKKNTCPLSLDNNCVPAAHSCGAVDVITCRRLFRAYSLGYSKATETARAEAKEKQEETPEILNTKIHNGGGYAIGRKNATERIEISKPALYEKPVTEFIERMRARGFNVETDGVKVTITGDNIDEHYSEIQKLALYLNKK